MAEPVSHNGLKQFWKRGVSGSISFYVNVSREFSLGIGMDVAQFMFRPDAFSQTYPAVTVQSRDPVWGSVYVGGKMSLLPSMRTCPYVTATLGASRLTEALYRQVVDEARVTYYHIGGSTRLTFGLAVGADIYISRWLAAVLEARGWYVHNDPDIGLIATGRGGFRCTL